MSASGNWKDSLVTNILFLHLRCYVGTRNPGDLILMEDLNLGGYKAANRLVGLDYDHVKLTIAKLAKFHAASVVYVEKVRLSKFGVI